MWIKSWGGTNGKRIPWPIMPKLIPISGMEYDLDSPLISLKSEGNALSGKSSLRGAVPGMIPCYGN